MDEVEVVNGDITIRTQVAGDGPLIVCVHGWPELAHSWRHQVHHFVDAGYRVAAIDVRGYGGSSAPPEVERYTLAELASDVAAVVAHLGDEPAILFGHDWGAPIAYRTAILHPDRVRAVAGMSVPATPPSTASLVDLFELLHPDRFFYILHFQQPGVVEREFDDDLRDALKRVYFTASGDGPAHSLLLDAPRGAPFVANLASPPPGPLAFLPDADLDVYVATFARTGMTGGLNRYRALPLDGRDSAAIEGALITQPSCFVAGEHDAVRHMVPGADLFADPGAGCADFRGSTIVAGAGHWIQQEAPAAVNAALAEFLAGL